MFIPILMIKINQKIFRKFGRGIVTVATKRSHQGSDAFLLLLTSHGFALKYAIREYGTIPIRTTKNVKKKTPVAKKYGMRGPW